MVVIHQRAAQFLDPAQKLEKNSVPVDIRVVEKTENNRKRIVETTRVEKTSQPVQDAFLGEQNQRVDKQMVSKGAMTVPGGGTKSASQRTQPQKSESRKTQGGAQNLSHLGVPIFHPNKTNRMGDSPVAERRADAPQWASDGAGPNIPRDYIEGIAESDRTALNTREYIFFGYFQRIRSRLDLAWTKTLRTRLEKLYRRGRSIASAQELKTRTWVTLDTKGTVVRVRLVEESGVLDLDEAAVSAFNEAGPFPNPPRGLIDEKGQIELHWDFVLRN